MNTLIEQALTILAPYAAKCQVEEYEHWIILKENPDDYDGVDTETSESFCGGCIHQAMKDYAEQNPDECKGKVVSFENAWNDGFGSDDFKRCLTCGKHIATSLDLCEQELEHWEGLTNLDCFVPEIAYELREIIGYWDEKAFEERRAELARRVIREHEILEGPL